MPQRRAALPPIHHAPSPCRRYTTLPRPAAKTAAARHGRAGGVRPTPGPHLNPGPRKLLSHPAPPHPARRQIASFSPPQPTLPCNPTPPHSAPSCSNQVCTGEAWLATHAQPLGLVDYLSTSDGYLRARASEAQALLPRPKLEPRRLNLDPSPNHHPNPNHIPIPIPTPTPTPTPTPRYCSSGRNRSLAAQGSLSCSAVRLRSQRPPSPASPLPLQCCAPRCRLCRSRPPRTPRSPNRP